MPANKKVTMSTIVSKSPKTNSFLATFISLTDKKIEEELDCVPYIFFTETFKKQTKALLD